MYNLYYKGLSTDTNELDDIKRFFKENKVNLDIVFDNYNDLPLTSVKSLNSILRDKFRQANPMGQKANLICQAMGCNIGILTAINTLKINKMVLISPEFGNFTEEELEQIKYEQNGKKINKPYGENKKSLNSKTVKSLIIANKTQGLAKVAIEKINVPILIIYPKDDAYIPKTYLNKLSERKDNIKIATIDTKMHNPLTTNKVNQKTIRLIKKHLA